MRRKLGSRGWQQCCARPKIVAAAVCALLVFLPRTTLARDYKDEIAALYGWTCEQGRPQRFQKKASALLGIPSASDVPILRKAYEDNQTKVMYVFQIFSMNGVPKIVMLRLSKTLSALWLVSEDGRILSAAEVTTKGFGPVALDRYREYFLETKDFLLKERSHAVAEHALTGNCQAIPEFTGK